MNWTSLKKKIKYENQFPIKLSAIIDNIKDSELFCVGLKQL